jgi:hypothetical protein
MALQSHHESMLQMIVTGSRAEALSLVSAQTCEGRHKAILCCLLSHQGEETYFPLAILADLDGDELLSSLAWPQLSCPVLIPSQKGMNDGHE